MINLCEYILKSTDQKLKIQKWIKTGYQSQPLVIYGCKGTFKSTLAKYILKDRVTLNVDIDFCKKKLSFSDYIESSLYKKSITMMFQDNSNIMKALIIDDLIYIMNNDKSLFKSIIDFSKQNNNHPIIYIVDNVDNKNIKNLYKNSCKLYLHYSLDQEKYIVKHFFNKQISEKEIISLINKSNHNFNSVKINLDFYKKSFETINQYEKTEDSILDITKDILNTRNIGDLYRKSSSDYSIIGLNIVDNFTKWVYAKKDLSYKNKIKIIDSIYYNNCISDYLSMYIHLKNDWDLSDNITTFSIFIPTLTFKLYDISIGTINYNGYISKSIINTHSNKLFSLHGINANIVTCFYHYFYLYFISNKKQKYDTILRHIIKKYNLEIKIVERYYKIYCKYYLLESKPKLKLFF